MSYPSTPERAQRPEQREFLEGVLSPHSRHAVPRLIQATIGPTKKMLDELAALAPAQVEKMRNQTVKKMKQDKEDYESAHSALAETIGQRKGRSQE